MTPTPVVTGGWRRGTDGEPCRWLRSGGRLDGPRPSRQGRHLRPWFETPWGRCAFAVEAQCLRERAGPVDDDLVLDAGGGTARFAAELTGGGARVVGLDIDQAMLDAAARRGPGPFVAGDTAHLPFADAVFDVAVAVTVLEFVVDPDGAFAELVRVTRPGGRVVIGALNVRSPWGLLHRRRPEQWAGARFFRPGDLRSLGAHGCDDGGETTEVRGWR